MLRTLFLVAGLVDATGVAFAQDAKPRVAEVAFPSDLIATGGRDNPAFRDVDKTLLPVLVPAPFFDSKALQFVGQELEYSASVPLKGAFASATGTRIAIDTGTQDGIAPGTTEIEYGDKSVSASVVRYGAAYVVSVECNTFKDKRCSDDGYVRELVRAFDLVGGGKTTPTQAPKLPARPGLIGVSSGGFEHDPAGLLESGGKGVTSTFVYAPNIRFPIVSKPSYVNSQVYGYGGSHGTLSPRNWKDERNYRYPWHDTFCEPRARKTPVCPSGTGHQGLDIRPADPSDRKYVAVAVEAGRINKIGTYSVTLAGNSGNHYNYLHLSMARLRVHLGEQVQEGQPIGLVSHDFAGTPTPVHLHFEMMQNTNGRGWRHVAPYSSLVRAYEAM